MDLQTEIENREIEDLFEDLLKSFTRPLSTENEQLIRKAFQFAIFKTQFFHFFCLVATAKNTNAIAPSPVPGPTADTQGPVAIAGLDPEEEGIPSISLDHNLI